MMVIYGNLIYLHQVVNLTAFMLTILQPNVNSRYRVSMWLPLAKAQQPAQNLTDKVIRGAVARDDLNDGGPGFGLPS